MDTKNPDYIEVLEFWFSDRVTKKHWIKDPDFDNEIRTRFLEIYELAIKDQLTDWRKTPQGRLAEIIVLDQFPRNMFRDTARAFASDDRARSLTHAAVDCGADKDLPASQLAFLYMPLMHSECMEDHELAVTLYSSDTGLANNLKFELRHKKIIDQFRRYPHRNKIVGRESTPEELKFLNQPGSSF